MALKTITIYWSERAKTDVRQIYEFLLERNSKEVSQKIRDEIIAAPETIVYPEQFQHDEYMDECRRIIVRNYKILYIPKGTSITIISVFNTHRHPSKMKG